LTQDVLTFRRKNGREKSNKYTRRKRIPRQWNENKACAPEWAWEFHGHRCPFLPIDWRMEQLAMEDLK
jgi:formylmethanofuran dehydrogenase subunit E